MSLLYRKDLKIGKFDVVIISRPNGICESCGRAEAEVVITSSGPGFTTMTRKQALEVGNSLIAAAEAK